MPIASPTGRPDARRLSVRRRPDLEIQPQQYGGRRYWVIKDPVALSYYYLREEEHAIFAMLDGQVTAEEIQQRFEREFAPMRLAPLQLHRFLHRLHEAGLVLAEGQGQGEELLRRHAQRRRRALGQSLLNLLAIRVPGVDPEPLLGAIYPLVRWMFSRWFLGAVFLGILAAAGLAMVRFDEVRARLPDASSFFTLQNLVWLAIALAGTKVLHELGHALTCYHFGAECHEIGLMFLVFTPCLYCDVSDAWRLPDKWARIAISAAGIVVELALAALATFLWWFSQPGWLNGLLLAVMTVCSVNTVLLNGNPLLRYDGYYVLADLVEVPNLAQRSRAMLQQAYTWFFLGIGWRNDDMDSAGRQWRLAIYGAAAAAYRLLVVVAILWFCHQLLRPQGLQLLSGALALSVLGGMIVGPSMAAARGIREPAVRRQVRPWRLLATVALTVAVLAGLLSIPFPARVGAPAVLEARDAERVYVTVPGVVVDALPLGKPVRRGEVIARLEDLRAQREIVEWEGRRKRQELVLRNLRLRQGDDPTIAAQIPPAEEALADLDARLAQRRRDQQRLILRAPRDGVVLAPPAQAEPTEPDRLPRWSGTPLDEVNRGCYLPTGTLLCLVGDPAVLEATLVVDQGDLRSLARGQWVHVRVDELPGAVLRGRLSAIAEAEAVVPPRELAAGRELPLRRDAQGRPRLAETSYQATVELERAAAPLRLGSKGWGYVQVEPRSLAWRLIRFVARNFEFKL